MWYMDENYLSTLLEVFSKKRLQFFLAAF